jgi:methyl-accepting chemotaxis protein
MASADLSEPLEFMKLGPETQAHIRAVKPVIMSELPGAMDVFYEQIRAFPQTRKFFSDHSQIAGAKRLWAKAALRSSPRPSTKAGKRFDE